MHQNLNGRSSEILRSRNKASFVTAVLMTRTIPNLFVDLICVYNEELKILEARELTVHYRLCTPYSVANQAMA